MQPGETITPGQTPAPTPPGPPAGSPQPQQQPPVAPAPVPPQPSQPAPPSPKVSEGAPAQTPQEEVSASKAEPQDVAPQDQAAEWKFTSDDTSQEATDAAPPAPAVDPVSWTASEYVQHHKNALWYLLAGLAIVALAAVVYFLTRDVTSGVVIGVAGLAFAAFGARPPQVLDYMVDGTGVHIGQKFYPYGDFRSFSVLQEDATKSILLMPAQRVGLPITIYYDPKDEDKIVGVIGSSLPHEAREVSLVDKFTRKIRF